jgi:hypothetical protein
MACHWEDCDVVVQEMYSNASVPQMSLSNMPEIRDALQDSLICICIAFAIHTFS